MNNIDKTTRSNMGYCWACRTNVTSTLRLLKRVICYTKLVFSLKWLGLSAGEILRLNTIAHISKNIWIWENRFIFPNTPWWDLSFGTFKRTKFQNVMVLYLTEINSTLKWWLLYLTVDDPNVESIINLWKLILMIKAQKEGLKISLKARESASKHNNDLMKKYYHRS